MAVIAEVTLRGNPETRFEDLYAACQPRVFRTCLAILRNADDAAEATQEVFSRALPLLTELREPHVWLTTVARNYCFDQLRRQKVRGIGATLDDEIPGSLRDDPERETMLRDALRQAFEALTPRERRALARVLLMDDSLADIASMLGVSYSAAAQVVSRARRRAALAARAVIGASLGWLARITVGRDRSRAGRAMGEILSSGQHVLLAAVVLFTAGSLARNAEAVAPPHTDGTPRAPRLVVAATNAGDGVLPAASGVSVTGIDPGSPLPPGYHRLPARLVINSSPPPPSQPGGPVPPQQQLPVSVTVTPTFSGDCPGVTAGAGTSSGTLVPTQSVSACQP